MSFSSVNKAHLACAAIGLAAILLFYALGPFPPFWIKSEIQSSLVEWANDPSSIEFRDVRYSHVDSDMVCGKLNAKNAMGAYTGFRSFAYSKTQHFTFVEGIDSSADRMIKMFQCGD